VGSDHYIKYARGDGSFWSFGYNAGNWSVAAPASVSATLVQGTTNWTLTFQNGEQRLFTISTGKLAAIVDRNGNTTQLTYDSLGRLITVTDPASRHLYFGYTGGTYLVASVTSDFGVSVSYSYDGQGRLSQVTEPDSSTLSFQYDGNSFISAVLDSQGKTLEAHTYDTSGRGLTGTRANGVDAVTITY
jgi:YD repeat-containing protein